MLIGFLGKFRYIFRHYISTPRNHPIQKTFMLDSNLFLFYPLRPVKPCASFIYINGFKSISAQTFQKNPFMLNSNGFLTVALLCPRKQRLHMAATQTTNGKTGSSKSRSEIKKKTKREIGLAHNNQFWSLVTHHGPKFSPLCQLSFLCSNNKAANSARIRAAICVAL